MIKKVINPSKRGYSFTNSEICDAILLRSISSKAYEMLRKNSILALPQRTTLSRRVSHFRCEPGLQMEFFKLLKLDLSVREERACESVLMFDEMQISQSIEYCTTFKRLLPAYKKV